MLRGLPMFAPLPIAMTRSLRRAPNAGPPTGTEIIRQGEEGDWFDVIDEVTLEAVVDGRVLVHRGAGDASHSLRSTGRSLDGDGSRHDARAPGSLGPD